MDTTRSRRIVSQTERRGRLRPAGAAGGLPERSRNAPRMRASDIRPHCPPHAASAVVPRRRRLLRPFVLRLYLRARCFTDSAMMHRETIGIDMGRGERGARQVRGRDGPHLRRMHCEGVRKSTYPLKSHHFRLLEGIVSFRQRSTMSKESGDSRMNLSEKKNIYIFFINCKQTDRLRLIRLLYLS